MLRLDGVSARDNTCNFSDTFLTCIYGEIFCKQIFSQIKFRILSKYFVWVLREDAFLVHVEKNWLQNCSSDFKPHYYRRYVGDIFVLFTSPKYLEAFQNFLNGRHANMSFTIECKKQKRCPFLMYRLFMKIKYLPLLSTVNLPLVEFIHILTVFIIYL